MGVNSDDRDTQHLEYYILNCTTLRTLLLQPPISPLVLKIFRNRYESFPTSLCHVE
jgi:hypothetical protein